MKLGYIIGFIVLFLLLGVAVSAAAVVVLGGGKGDPGSVGDKKTFDRVNEAQEAIAYTAETIAKSTKGEQGTGAAKSYEEDLKKYGLNPNCTSCSAFSTYVMIASGVDLNFPRVTADNQIDLLIKQSEQSEQSEQSGQYHIFAITNVNSINCGGKPADDPKRGDLLYARKYDRVKNKEYTYGHAAVYLGFTNNLHRIASASLRTERSTGRSPVIAERPELPSNFDCGARLNEPVTPTAGAS